MSTRDSMTLWGYRPGGIPIKLDEGTPANQRTREAEGWHAAIYRAGTPPTGLRWQAYEEQAQAGQCECCATGGHNDRPCIVCGHYTSD